MSKLVIVLDTELTINELETLLLEFRNTFVEEGTLFVIKEIFSLKNTSPKFNSYYHTGIVQYDDEGMKCFIEEKRDLVNAFINRLITNKTNFLKKSV